MIRPDDDDLPPGKPPRRRTRQRAIRFDDALWAELAAWAARERRTTAQQIQAICEAWLLRRRRR